MPTDSTQASFPVDPTDTVIFTGNGPSGAPDIRSQGGEAIPPELSCSPPASLCWTRETCSTADHYMWLTGGAVSLSEKGPSLRKHVSTMHLGNLSQPNSIFTQRAGRALLGWGQPSRRHGTHQHSLASSLCFLKPAQTNKQTAHPRKCILHQPLGLGQPWGHETKLGQGGDV